MKKVLWVFFMVFITNIAHAQFGIRAGYSSANFSDTNFSPKSGFHAGVYFTAGSDLIQVEPGIQFAGKGYTGEDDNGTAIDEQLNYLDLPVLVRLSLMPILNVFAGPQASFLLSRNYQLGQVSSNSLEVISAYDLGGVVGAQLQLPAGINFQASYDIGLKSLNYFDTDVKNRVFKISLGYTLK
ncbi:porin family protein [Algoriphagus mannitolivorans]|uniref:porin family protein n=1 Tax=Algoriphagus mannitolivorans TaxID=226504 RepID=UPI0003F7F647|nr:porin family protein [Algoriphagus mannitolivorans]